MLLHLINYIRQNLEKLENNKKSKILKCRVVYIIKICYNMHNYGKYEFNRL
jgi:hypothetical protein